MLIENEYVKNKYANKNMKYRHKTIGERSRKYLISEED